MEGQDGDAHTDLIDRALASATGSSFFQVVRRLNRFARRAGKKALGPNVRPKDEPVRFRTTLGMRHPASEISAATRTPDQKPELTVSFLGLTGPMGVLPDFYTELAIAQRQARRPALTAFLDLFNHRTISLFYRAWAKYRLPIRYEEATRPVSDPFSIALASIAGFGLGPSQGQLDEDKAHLLSVASIFARGSVSPQALKTVIRSRFDFPLQVEELRGRWITIPEHERTVLGQGARAFSQLGSTAVIGTQVWDVQGRFRLRIGPVGFDAFNRFFEDNDLRRELKAIVKLAAGHGLDFDVQLVLKREEAPMARLASGAGPITRLGQTSWMHQGALERDVEDAILAC